MNAVLPKILPPNELAPPAAAGVIVPLFPQTNSASASSVDLALDQLRTRGWLERGWATLEPKGQIIAISEELSHWFEKPAVELVGLDFWELLTARCLAWGDQLDKLRQSNDHFAAPKLRLASAEGALPQWYRLEIARNVAGAFVRLGSMLPPLEDLEEASWDEYLRLESARREMVVRLLRAESQLQSMTQRWPGVIFSQRADFTFRFVSPKIEHLTGVSVADWQTKPQLFWHRVHEGDAEELRQQLKQALRTRQATTNTYRIRHALTGRVTYVMEYRQPVVSSGGLLLGYEGIWLDVTRQTIAEKRLSLAAWKETLSVVTMGLAHDFGNVMAGIHALSESFLAQAEPEHPFHEGLDLIKKSSQQASQLVHRIITLHQGRTGENNYHNLNDLATDLADLTRKIIPRRTQFGLELCQESLPVYLDAVEFRQVVINLVLNAIDAMPQKGRLTIRTTFHQETPPLAHVHGKIPRKPCVSLSVQDTGCGIKPKHLESIFDPFFTTKPMNKGSGLGLYNSRLFVEKHRGAISVESTEGAGTTFHLWLPQADFTEAERDQKRSDTSLVPRSLLVIGPAGRLLEGTAEFFRLNGYHTICAISVEEASGCLRSPDYQFSAVYVLMEPTDHGLQNWLHDIRTQLPQLKRVIQVAGGDSDDLSAETRATADLIVTADLQQATILDRLKTMLTL